MKKILLAAIVLCSTIAYAEDNQITENNTFTETEQLTASTEMPLAVAPQYYESSSSGFDYHKIVDAVFINFGILSGDEYSLGFDVGKDFFIGYDYIWGTLNKNMKNEENTSEHRISLGVRPTMYLLKFLFFQCKVGAEYTFGKYRNQSGQSHIDALIEPRFGVKIGSGGVAASYRFDVEKFKFSNTITGHICVSAFYYF